MKRVKQFPRPPVDAQVTNLKQSFHSTERAICFSKYGRFLCLLIYIVIAVFSGRSSPLSVPCRNRSRFLTFHHVSPSSLSEPPIHPASVKANHTFRPTHLFSWPLEKQSLDSNGDNGNPIHNHDRALATVRSARPSRTQFSAKTGAGARAAGYTPSRPVRETLPFPALTSPTTPLSTEATLAHFQVLTEGAPTTRRALI